MLSVKRTFVVGALLAFSTAGFADERSAAALDACTAEVQRFYGAETEVKLVQTRRTPGSVHLRLATQVDADNARFSTCVVGRDGIAALEPQQGERMVASVPLPGQD